MAEPHLSTTRTELQQLIRQRALKENRQFKTPSKIVRSYFDFLEISLKHRGIELAGQLLYEEIRDLDIQAIGGPHHGIASILCRAAFLKEIGVFYVRDSPKKEGDLQDRKWIESRIRTGDRLALAGDVITSGSQIIRALEEVLMIGGQVVKIVIFLDSGQGDGLKAIRNYLASHGLQCQLSLLFTKDDILSPAEDVLWP